ncbi:MAG: hypothetical protein JNG86_22770 [Verrucomicrobiaceae bacterium]|nr:hypothetical protein [Verrucomicrobiaceae bacterium]
MKAPALTFVILAFASLHSASAHPADQSDMQVKPAPHALEVRFTFNLLTVTKCVRIDADGDGKLSVDELKAAEPVFTKYLNDHILLEVNQKKAAWGEKAEFKYLWPNFEKTPPMPEMEYAARNVDVTFVLPQKALLEDFWIGFEIFEQTGPMQTIRGVFQQDDQILEVPFSFQEPEYTYDTGYADDPFVQQAEKKAAEQAAAKPAAAPESADVDPRWWWRIPLLVAVILLWRKTNALRRHTSK